MCSAFDKPMECLEGMKDLFAKIQRVKDEDFPLVLVVRTKSDLDHNALDLKAITDFVKSIKSCYVSTSALSGINVALPFQLAYEGVMKQRHSVRKPTRKD